MASLRDGDREVVVLRCDSASKGNWTEHVQGQLDDKTLKVFTSVTRLARFQYLEVRTPLTPQLPNSLTSQQQKSSIFARFLCALLRFAHKNLHKNFGFLELGS